MGGEHVKHVLEGGGKVRLEGKTLTREKVGNISRDLATARQAAGTGLLCPVSPQPA